MYYRSAVVTVVVTTRNEELNIGNCLRSVIDQDYKNIELIVVDNNSEDLTKEIATRFTEKVFNQGPERSAQRNFGLLEKSSGDYVAFFDADMVLAPNLISSCVSALEAAGDMCVGLHIDELILGRGWFSAVRRFERRFYTGTVIDGARFFRKRDLQVVGGFDESLPPGTEDWDLDLKLQGIGALNVLSNATQRRSSWATTFASERGITNAETFVGVFHNETELSPRRYLAKKDYYRSSVLAYLQKWGTNNPVVRRQLGPTYRLFTVFFESGKWRLVARAPWLFVCVLVLRVAIGFRLLMHRFGLNR